MARRVCETVGFKPGVKVKLHLFDLLWICCTTSCTKIHDKSTTNRSNGVAKPVEICWSAPKLPDRSQPLLGRSSPYYQDTWRRYCCLKVLFPIVDACLSCEDIARQSCTMVRRWRLFGDFCILHFQRAACSTFQTCILNSH